MSPVLLLLAIVAGSAIVGLSAAYFFRARAEETVEATKPPANVASAAAPVPIADEVRAIGVKIEQAMADQRTQGETQRQLLAQKLDSVRKTVENQRNHVEGLRNELRHEVQRRDAEMAEIRTQIGTIQRSVQLPSAEQAALPPAPPPPAEAPAPETDGADWAEASDWGDLPAAGPADAAPAGADDSAFEEAVFEDASFADAPFEMAPEPAAMDAAHVEAPPPVEAPVFEEAPSFDEAPAFEEATFDEAPEAATGAPVEAEPPAVEAPADAPADPFGEEDPFATAPLYDAPSGDSVPAADLFETWTPGVPEPEAPAPEPEPAPAAPAAPRTAFEPVAFDPLPDRRPAPEPVEAPPPAPAAPPVVADPPAAEGLEAPTADVPAEPPFEPASFAPPSFETAAFEPEEPAPFEPVVFDPAAFVDPPAPEPAPEPARASTPDPADGTAWVSRPATAAPEPAPALGLVDLDAGPEPEPQPAPAVEASEITPVEAPEDPTFEAPEDPVFEAPDMPAFEAPEGAEDLTVISSIDEDTQRLLYQHGVRTLDEIAQWGRGDARRIAGQVEVSEETIMNQWVFEAQAALFNRFSQQAGV